MAKQKYKRVQAGRLVREVLWTPSFPGDAPKARAEKAKCSSAARQKINDRYSWQKLKTALATNFCGTDLVITLTYDDINLPANRDQAKKFLRKFLSQLRAHRAARNEILFYIYCTEDKHGDARLHHHVVINGTGADYDIIRSLWAYGSNILIEPIDVYGYEELAKYLTKEPREYGHTEVGARTWTPSLNLRKPDAPPAEWVPGNVRLVPPPNAHVLQSESFENSWGSFSYIEYMLPSEPKTTKVRPRQRKKQ